PRPTTPRRGRGRDQAARAKGPALDARRSTPRAARSATPHSRPSGPLPDRSGGTGRPAGAAPTGTLTRAPGPRRIPGGGPFRGAWRPEGLAAPVGDAARRSPYRRGGWERAAKVATVGVRFRLAIATTIYDSHLGRTRRRAARLSVQNCQT